MKVSTSRDSSPEQRKHSHKSSVQDQEREPASIRWVVSGASDISRVSGASASTGSPARHSKPIPPVIEEDPDRPSGVTFSKSTVTDSGTDDHYRLSSVHSLSEDPPLDAGSSEPEARLMRLSTQIERHLSSIVAELGALATLKQDAAAIGATASATTARGNSRSARAATSSTASEFRSGAKNGPAGCSRSQQHRATRYLGA